LWIGGRRGGIEECVAGDVLGAVGVGEEPIVMMWMAHPNGIKCQGVTDGRSRMGSSPLSGLGSTWRRTFFQVYAIDREGEPAVTRKLSRGEVLAFFAQAAPCRVGMEACESSHYWAREIRALGHDVVLIPPAYTKP
jgi:transposase